MTLQDRIPVSDCAVRAYEDLGMEMQQRDVLNCVLWAFDAMSRIGSNDAFPRREKEIQVIDNKITLPDDFYKLIAFRRGDTIFEPAESNFTLFGKNSPYLAQSGAKASVTNPMGGTAVKFYRDGRYVHFSGISNGNIGIAYEHLPLDSSGMPTINPEHQMAVTAYIRYMLAQREFTRGKMSQPVFYEQKSMWNLRCKQADHNPLTAQERAECRAILNSLLPFRPN